jgi:hypothetical protein
MKKNNNRNASGQQTVQNLDLPSHVRAVIKRGRRAFTKGGQFTVVKAFSPKLRTLTQEQKNQDARDKICNVLAKAAKDTRGQPPMVERLRATAIMVDYYESVGVPFRVGVNSKMNKAIRNLLNNEVKSSTDKRKSRQKEIRGTTVRALLRKVRRLRFTADLLIQSPPYTQIRCD